MIEEIKATELRIGNNIYWLHEESEQPLTVDAAMIMEIDDYNRFPDKDEYARGMWWAPIPLSPSILEKCGFELHNTNGWFPFWTKKHTHVLVEWSFEIESMDEVEYRWLEGNTNVPFYYVHQLQNLWYSLTQTELKIQLQP